MTTTLYLHVGHNKTGSSFLQQDFVFTPEQLEVIGAAMGRMVKKAALQPYVENAGAPPRWRRVLRHICG